MFKRFQLGSTLFASFVATFFMTIFLSFFSIDLIKQLGLIAQVSYGWVCIIGISAHFGIGFLYGLSYALFFEPLFHRLSPFFCALLFSFFPITVISLHGEQGLQEILSRKIEKTITLPAQERKGEEYFHHLKKKREKMGQEKPVQLTEVTTSSSQDSLLWILIGGHVLFTLSLGLIYQPRQIKIWCL